MDAAKVLFRRIALVLGSIHLTLMAALGLWLWSAPQSFGTSDTNPECAFNFAKVTILGLRVPFSSSVLRVLSITIYSLFLVPGLNLLPPVLLFATLHIWHHARYAKDPPLPLAAPQPSPVLTGTTQQSPSSHEYTQTARSLKSTLSGLVQSTVFPVYIGLAVLLLVNVILIADVELTLLQNRGLQSPEESEWGFGQILAMLLVSMPLRDLVEAIFRRRQEMQTKLDNALKKAIDDGDTKEISRWINAGADPSIESASESYPYYSISSLT